MSLSAELREETRDWWNALETHPFVRQMASGTLPLECFRFYIDQNLLYLPEYARALAIGITRSSNRDELGWFTAAVDNIVHVEIPENEELRDRVDAMGVRPHPRADSMAPATLAYTSYLIATASRTDALGIMALILPCAWTYGDIALANRPASVSHPVYSEWLRFFSTPEYAEVVSALRSDMDSLAEGASRRQREEVLHIFANGVRLEHAFWDMAMAMEHWTDPAT